MTEKLTTLRPACAFCGTSWEHMHSLVGQHIDRDYFLIALDEQQRKATVRTTEGKTSTIPACLV